MTDLAGRLMRRAAGDGPAMLPYLPDRPTDPRLGPDSPLANFGHAPPDDPFADPAPTGASFAETPSIAAPAAPVFLPAPAQDHSVERLRAPVTAPFQATATAAPRTSLSHVRSDIEATSSSLTPRAVERPAQPPRAPAVTISSGSPSSPAVDPSASSPALSPAVVTSVSAPAQSPANVIRASAPAPSPASHSVPEPPAATVEPPPQRPIVRRLVAPPRERLPLAEPPPGPASEASAEHHAPTRVAASAPPAPPQPVRERIAPLEPRVHDRRAHLDHPFEPAPPRVVIGNLHIEVVRAPAPSAARIEPSRGERSRRESRPAATAASTATRRRTVFGLGQL